MKTLIVTIVMMLMMTIGYSQTQKGNVFIGADLANFDVDFQDDNTLFNLDLTPKAAWFIADNTALGAEVLFGLNTQKGSTSISYGVGALARKYKGAAATNLTRTTKWFLEANVGIYGTNLTGTNITKTSTNGLGIGVGPGLAYFVSPTIALEALAKYNLTVGFGSSTTTNSLGLAIGFQIYLPGKAVQQTAQDPLKP